MKFLGQHKFFLLFFSVSLCLCGKLFLVTGCQSSTPPATATPPTIQEVQTIDQLKNHVTKLAGQIGPRNVAHYPNLEVAAKYIEATLQQYGYKPAAQIYSAKGKDVRNIEAELSGSKPTTPMILIGAQYDCFDNSPGADSNASGVAATLELARLLKNSKPNRTIRFVFFVNEDEPFVKTPLMGSKVYADRCKHRGEKIAAMLDMDTLGYYTNAKGSQSYPFPFNLMRTNVGNFMAIVANHHSHDLMKSVATSFKQASTIPVQDDAVPESIAGLDTSAQWNFWKAGYPALLITDTSDTRYPYYHKPTDTPDKLTYDTFSQVVLGLKKAVEDLAK